MPSSSSLVRLLCAQCWTQVGASQEAHAVMWRGGQGVSGAGFPGMTADKAFRELQIEAVAAFITASCTLLQIYSSAHYIK